MLDSDGDFARRCNHEMVLLEPVVEPEDIGTVRRLVQDHLRFTGSGPAARVLELWDETLPKFVKVFPIAYKQVLEERRKRAEQESREMVAADG